MRPSQEDERIPVLAQFMRTRNVQRPAFVGLKDVLFSSSFGDGLASLDDVGLVADHRLILEDDEPDPAAIARVTADLKRKNPDLVVLALGARAAAPMIAALVAAASSRRCS
jgi:hypothetical protein